MTDQPRGVLAEAADAGLAALCDWAATLPVEALPPAILARAMAVLADDIGAAVSAAPEPELVALRALILARPGPAEATLLAPGLPRTSRQAAAAYNAVSGCWNELDGGFRPVTCHAGVYVLPALLAEAEATGLSLAALLRALVLGYEIVARIASAYRFGTPKVHAHAAFAPVAAAAGLSLARRLPPEALLRAVTGAATMASLGPRGHLVSGVMIRNGWAAAGAACGALAADWAMCGFGGAAHSVRDVYGTLLEGQLQPQALTEGLGEHWSVSLAYHKLFACCQHGHPTIDALLALMAHRPVDPAAVTDILIETHPLALTLGTTAPTTTLGAKFSMPHMAATTLVHCSGGAEAFGAASLDHPEVARLRGLVRLAPYDPLPAPPHDRPARVSLTLADGTVLRGECLSAPGNPDRPIDAEALRGKVASMAGPALPGLVQALDSAPDAALLARPWGEVLADFAAAEPGRAPLPRTA